MSAMSARQEEHRKMGQELEVLDKDELVWVSRYKWLQSLGLELRPRYHPDWKPSWLRTNKDWRDAPDAIKLSVSIS
jgi:hypothetical protein